MTVLVFNFANNDLHYFCQNYRDFISSANFEPLKSNVQSFLRRKVVTEIKWSKTFDFGDLP